MAMAEAVAAKRHTPDDDFERDKDSLYILPLSCIPLDTAALRHARLVKNVQLRGVIEVFADASTGSGQLEIEDLPKEFGWPEDSVHPDLAKLRGLGRLPSYDVYSLRILLRRLDIEVNDVVDLRLSPGKTHELTSYMRVFTGPLIQQVYGDSDVAVKNFSDIVNLFKEPNVAVARRKLEQLADKLGIMLIEVPKFLEDFGDIFLSLSYYKSYLDNIQPKVGGFIAGLEEIRGNYQLRQNRILMKTCDALQEKFNDLTSEITGRFENFYRSTDDMWANISAERFRRVEALISGYHTTIGGVLCALGAKVNAWEDRFPNANTVLLKRAEFIMTDMRQGLENIRQLESNAPMLAALNHPGVSVIGGPG
jgi:hypothetical protein